MPASRGIYIYIYYIMLYYIILYYSLSYYITLYYLTVCYIRASPARRGGPRRDMKETPEAVLYNTTLYYSIQFSTKYILAIL